MNDFVGKRLGKNNQVIVIEKLEGGKYKCSCDICSKDEELFPQKHFIAYGSNLKKGSIPCACAYVFRWSKEQFKIKIERKCKEINLLYLGQSEEWRGARTRLNLQCNVCKANWDTTNITSLLTMGTGCRFCKGKSTEEDFSNYLDRLHQNKSFLTGTVFKIIEDDKSSPSASSYECYCPRCSEDEFVKEGLCTGKFKSVGNELMRSTKPCRCSRSYKWTVPQQLYKIRKQTAKFPNISFLGWAEDYTNKNTKVKLLCNVHNTIHTPSVSCFINANNMCPLCNASGFKREKSADLYVIYVKGENHDFVGYGISNKIEKRFRSHNKNLKEAGFEIQYGKFFTMKGIDALSIETSISRNFEMFPQNVAGFITEATLAENYDALLTYIEKELHEIRK